MIGHAEYLDAVVEAVQKMSGDHNKQHEQCVNDGQSTVQMLWLEGLETCRSDGENTCMEVDCFTLTLCHALHSLQRKLAATTSQTDANDNPQGLALQKKNDNTVKSTRGDLLLCLYCEEITL